MQTVFVALELPVAVQEVIDTVQRDLKKHDFFKGTYVLSQQAHVTLGFIGPVVDADVQSIHQALSTTPVVPCTLVVKGLGIFTHGNRATIYIVAHSDGVSELARLVQQSLSIPNVRPLVPHITIARARQVYDHEALVAYVQSTQVPNLHWQTETFVLKKSIRGPTGTTYEVLHTYWLKNE